jgi:hypothetical protein
MYTHVLLGLEAPASCPQPGWLVACSEEACGEEEGPVSGPEEIRWDLVARVRGEIASGTYETEEKWEAALDRLLGRLGLVGG